MFIELTKKQTNGPVLVNSDHILKVYEEEGLTIICPRDQNQAFKVTEPYEEVKKRFEMANYHENRRYLK